MTFYEDKVKDIDIFRGDVLSDVEEDFEHKFLEAYNKLVYLTSKQDFIINNNANKKLMEMYFFKVTQFAISLNSIIKNDGYLIEFVNGKKFNESKKYLDKVLNISLSYYLNNKNYKNAGELALRMYTADYININFKNKYSLISNYYNIKKACDKKNKDCAKSIRCIKKKSITGMLLTLHASNMQILSGVANFFVGLICCTSRIHKAYNNNFSACGIRPA